MNAPRTPDERAALVVLHTTDIQGVVGVAHGSRVTGELLDSPGQHARSLLGALERALQRSALSLDAVAGVVVTLGPGSFTGIRIGLATAQGLAAARGCFVWACDSLLAEAAAPLPDATPAAVTSAASRTARPDPVAVVQDARRGEVYAALYDVGSRVPHELVAPFCGEPRAARERLLSASPARSCSARGSGASLVAGLPGTRAAISVQARPGGLAVVEALVTLAREGACRRFEAHQLEPIYLRKSDAEIKRERTS
jgi:tRNA threonylcarbamoyladenosine biosynthesis protein TsaB